MRASLVMSLVCGTLAALPQDASESRPAAALDAAPLRKALTALLDSKGFRLSGDVGSKNHDDASGGMSHVMVIGGGGGGGGTPFSGGIEVERTAKGALFIVSKSRLPGFAALDDGERAVVSTTFENDAPDTSAAVGDLTALLNLDELLKASGSASSSIDSATGATTWKLSMPKRLLKASSGSGPLSVTQPRVKWASATVVVSREGAVTSLKLSVMRTDPMAGIKRRAMEQAADGGGGSIAAGADDMGGDDDGATSVYTLKPATGEASKRAKRELEHLQRAISDD